MTTIYLVMRIDCEGNDVLGAASTQEKAETLEALYQELHRIKADDMEIRSVVLDDIVDRRAAGNLLYCVEYDDCTDPHPVSIERSQYWLESANTGTKFGKEGFRAHVWAKSPGDAAALAFDIRKAAIAATVADLDL